MVKHFLVNVCGEDVLALGETPSEARTSAIARYFRNHPELVGQAIELTAPCQWNGDCPEGVKNCSECLAFFRQV